MMNYTTYKQSEKHDHFSTLQYQIELLANGSLALFGLWLDMPILFYALILMGVSELLFGYPRSPINFVTAALRKPLRLDRFHTRKRVPPKVVLDFNSIAMVMMSVVCIYLASAGSGLLWVPAYLLGSLAMLAGTTGICPVALTYALIARKQTRDGCLPVD